MNATQFDDYVLCVACCSVLNRRPEWSIKFGDSPSRSAPVSSFGLDGFVALRCVLIKPSKPTESLRKSRG